MEWYHIVEAVGGLALTFLVGYGFGRANMKVKVLDAMKGLSIPDYERLLKKLKL